jgi:mRNA-degrading endonuclease YafQ of YafQ-DinJ toxin-antitoxin module
LSRPEVLKNPTKKRISNNPKLQQQYRDRVELFIAGERGYPLDYHALTGTPKGERAFSVANDLRVIYIETDEAIIFLDIGTHNQVY